MTGHQSAVDNQPSHSFSVNINITTQQYFCPIFRKTL